MATAKEMAEVSALLKEGKVQEAADLSAKLEKEAAVAEALAAGKPLEPPPPRPVEVIVRAIFGQIAHDLGNRPALEALLHEFDEANPPPPLEPKPAAPSEHNVEPQFIL